VGPPELCAALIRVKQVADLHTSTLNQLLVADIVTDTEFMAGHLAELCSSYRSRSQALVRAVRAIPGRPMEIAAPDGGMFAWARLIDGRSSEDLLPRALDAGVAFVPGSAFSIDGGDRDRLRLCFTTLSVAEIGLAVDRLASVL
jgi:2-aminoadipate transaminase